MIRAGGYILFAAFLYAINRASKDIADEFTDWSSDVRTFGFCGELATARNAGGDGARRAAANKQIMSLTHDGGDR